MDFIDAINESFITRNREKSSVIDPWAFVTLRHSNHTPVFFPLFSLFLCSHCHLLILSSLSLSQLHTVPLIFWKNELLWAQTKASFPDSCCCMYLHVLCSCWNCRVGCTGGVRDWHSILSLLCPVAVSQSIGLI